MKIYHSEKLAKPALAGLRPLAQSQSYYHLKTSSSPISIQPDSLQIYAVYLQKYSKLVYFLSSSHVWLSNAQDIMIQHLSGNHALMAPPKRYYTSTSYPIAEQYPLKKGG